MNKTLYGMPTLLEQDTLKESVKLCKELGLDFVEINMNLPQYQRECLRYEELKRYMEQYHIFFTVHLDDQMNICDFNKDVAKAYIQTVADTIQIARQLRMPVINMHMAKGTVFTLPEQKVYVFEKYREQYFENLENFRMICEQETKGSQVKICIENCDGWYPVMREGIAILQQSESFGLTLDIGHNYCAGGVDFDFFASHIEKLRHMHLHNAVGQKDHQPLGRGSIDALSMLELADEQHCTCVLETKTIRGLRESVEYLKRAI